MLRKKELDIFELRLRGWSLEKIGKEYGITRERVRQILNKAYRKTKSLLIK